MNTVGDCMRKVITYGTFDLLHKGHVALLERAKKLGDYLIVGVTSDQYDRTRGKLNVAQSTIERVDAVRQTGLADLVLIEEYEGQKIEDIKRYGVDIFAIGSDWVGYFDYLSEWCEVVYLDRTEGISSTQLRAESAQTVHIGVIDDGRMSERFKREIEVVGGAAYSGSCLADEGPEVVAGLIEKCDALVVAAQFNLQSSLVEQCLRSGKHVLYTPPAFESEGRARLCMSLADENGLVFFEGLKTLYFPAFRRLLLLVESGRIGEIRDIRLSCSQAAVDFDLASAGISDSALLDWGGVAFMPIVQLLGPQYEGLTFKSFTTRDGCEYFTRCNFEYGSATASVTVGRGIKTEGDMVITGTKGYVYVPSPWWLTDYFEIRSEELSNARKYYWEYGGDGFRHELLEFVREIREDSYRARRDSSIDHVWTAHLIEKFLLSLDGDFFLKGGKNVGK